MTKSRDESSSGSFPREFRCAVLGDNQFNLPAELVREVGFKSPSWDVTQSAKVGWYYHEDDEKAVLANNTVDRSSLDLVGASALYGISNDELESGDVEGARVTIISDLPETLYDRLTRDKLVLRPMYATRHASLTGTCVSVYPRQEYDEGSLPPVRTDTPSSNDTESDETSDRVIERHNHANSV